jgi:predicted ATPase with chaperone activity
LQNYRNKLSGPLQDRIDMYVRIERPSNDEMILSQKELQEIVS